MSTSTASVIDLSALRGGAAGPWRGRSQNRRGVPIFRVLLRGRPWGALRSPRRRLAAAKAFFALPEDAKSRVAVNNRHRGHMAYGGPTRVPKPI